MAGFYEDTKNTMTMGKITPPTIVRIDTHEAVVSIRQLMETTATLQSLASTSPEPRNCQNCGAPLHGDKCEYCGTEYRTNKTHQ